MSSSSSGSGPSGTPPPAPASGSTATATFRPPTPKMGNVQQISDTEVVPWTGGVPKVDWSGLTDASKLLPITPSMYRAIASKDAKSYQFRIRGLSKKLDSTLTTPLNTFISAFMKHMQLHGLDTITYLVDPGDSTKMCSVVTHYTRFKLSNVTTASKNLYENHFDAYDKANDQALSLIHISEPTRPY